MEAALRPPLLPPLHLRRGHGKYSQGLQRLPGHYPAGTSQNVRDPLKAFPPKFSVLLRISSKNYLQEKKISELKSKLSLLLLLSTNYIIYINISSNNQCWQKFKKKKNGMKKKLKKTNKKLS